MSHVTEAAGLLRTGNLFLRRTGVIRPGADEIDILAGVKPGTRSGRPSAFALYYGDEPFFHFDLDGRWQRIYDEGTHYRKALDNSVDALARRREGSSLVMRRRSLAFAEIADLDDKARATALELLGDLSAGRLVLAAPPDAATALPLDELRDLLDRVTRWDAAAWFRHRERFIAAYDDPAPLPPDARLAILLQCRTPHDDQPRSVEEFTDHLQRVLALHGRRIEQANGVFLSRAELTQSAVDRVASYLETIRRHDPDGLLQRVTADLELRPEHPLPDVESWRTLRGLGLERLGIEAHSGSPELRRRRGLHWRDDDLRRAIEAVHAAGITVGLGVQATPGDHGPGAESHNPATIALVAALGLRSGDTVILMDPDVPASAQAGPHADDETLRGALLNGLRADRAPGVKVVAFDPEK